MGLYDQFQTDENMEREGVLLDYGDFKIRIAYAGGANKKYLNYAEVKLKPLSRGIKAGTISNERANAVMLDIFARTVVLDWFTRKEKENFVQGIEGPDGDILPFNEDNVKMTLTALPKLFADIQDQANQMSNFRQEVLEDEAKNS